jgi:hypothetical protein
VPEIKTLIPDIYRTISNKDGWFTEELATNLGQDISITLRAQLGEDRPASRLRLSQMGPRCPRALWYSVHQPELAEPLQAYAEIKFSFGHILEALAITLAKASGHEVTGEQDELVLDGVKGHRDCVIDGCIVDVKSASSRSFQKFKDKSLGQNDPFGYLDQLDGYVVASLDDPLVRVKDRGYLLAIDKQLGHMVLYEHIVRPDSIRARIQDYKRIVESSSPPPCECGTTPDGQSGNIKLDTRASYSNYKYACFPNLRTFLYADGPRYLTKVVRRPAEHIVEVDKHGHIVHS